MKERPKWEWAWIVGLAIIALVSRVVLLGRVPPGVRFDELVNVKMADHIYAGEWPIYFQEAWGHEPLYHYFHVAGMSLLGKTVLGVRLADTLQARQRIQHLPALGVATLMRLIVSPALTFLFASLVGLTGMARDVTILESAMPTAVITTILATEFDSDPPFAAICVLVTTLVSLPTLTVLLNVLM